MPEGMLLPFELCDTDDIVSLWLDSFKSGVGFPDSYTFDEQRDYLLEELLPSSDFRVARMEHVVVGFVAVNPTRILQLFVHVDYQGLGIGTRLVDWAKSQSKGSLDLWVYECNASARLFYHRQGFVEVDVDAGSAWRSPMLRLAWSASN